MYKPSRVWNGCWKKLWPEAVKVLHGAPKQWEEIRNIHVLACKVLGEWFSDFNETGIIHDAHNFHAAELTEKDIEQLTTHQITILSLLWRGLNWISKNSRRQMSLSIISLRSSISGRDAGNSSMTQRLSQHNRRRRVRTHNRRMESNWISPLSSLSNTRALHTGCYSTIGGAWRHTAEGKANKDDPFLCCTLCFLCSALCSITMTTFSQGYWQNSHEHGHKCFRIH